MNAIDLVDDIRDKSQQPMGDVFIIDQNGRRYTVERIEPAQTDKGHVACYIIVKQTLV